jgi:multiple sugar transport system permease protein
MSNLSHRLRRIPRKPFRNLFPKLDRLQKRKERWFWLFILPWVIGFLVFQLGPILYAGALSFSKFNFNAGLTWIGLQNYRNILADEVFVKTIGNTIYYTIGSVPLSLIVAFFLAFMLNQKVKGVTIFRTIFFLPSVIQGVAVYMLWGWIFNPKFGIINNLLTKLGITNPPGWLESETWVMPAIIIISLWGVGWMVLVYLAALQEIPEELYEACELDGGGFFQKIWYITLPMISPVTFFLLISGMISAMQIYAPAYVLTEGGPNFASTTISLLIYYSAFRWNAMGEGAAMAVLLFLAILLFTVIQFALSGRWVHYQTEVD